VRRKKLLEFLVQNIFIQIKFINSSKKINSKYWQRAEIRYRKIIAYKPDAIFTNYVASFENTYDVLKKMVSKSYFLDEYLKKTFRKSAYIKVFGKLLGMDKSAALIYNEIESNYHKL
jgi:iron complex transport system substrate-binding protein